MLLAAIERQTSRYYAYAMADGGRKSWCVCGACAAKLEIFDGQTNWMKFIPFVWPSPSHLSCLARCLTARRMDYFSSNSSVHLLPPKYFIWISRVNQYQQHTTPSYARGEVLRGVRKSKELRGQKWPIHPRSNNVLMRMKNALAAT